VFEGCRRIVTGYRRNTYLEVAVVREHNEEDDGDALESAVADNAPVVHVQHLASKGRAQRNDDQDVEDSGADNSASPDFCVAHGNSC
jgi:hypothetical protein